MLPTLTLVRAWPNYRARIARGQASRGEAACLECLTTPTGLDLHSWLGLGGCALLGSLVAELLDRDSAVNLA